MTYLLQSMFILIAAAVTSTPQNRRSIVLYIELSGCAGAPEEIDVVLDGDEGSQRPVVRAKGEDVWVGQWTDHRKRKFPSAPLSASVRLKNGRTYCRFATAAKDPNDRLVAKFLFHCDYAPVRQVTVGTIDPTSFEYERRLPKPSRKGDPLACNCVEVGTAVSGSQNVSELLFPHENFKISCTSSDRQGRFTQYFSTEISPKTWQKELSHARTAQPSLDVKDPHPAVILLASRQTCSVSKNLTKQGAWG